MQLPTTIFPIIRLKANPTEYYPSQKHVDDLKAYYSAEELKNKKAYQEMQFPLGQSRYGGALIDIPKNQAFPLERKAFDHPTYHPSKDGFDANYFRFAAQLDLAQIAAIDPTGLLPKQGQLYFFADIFNNKCQVFYLNVAKEDLKRIAVPHEDNFYVGCLIEDFTTDTERFEDHLRALDEEELEEIEEWEDSEHQLYAKDEITPDGKVWDEFAGAQTSKLFGIFTHCQWSKEEIIAQTNSNELVLLQIGEDGFNDEGVFCVSISKTALEGLDFGQCSCYWAQS